MNGKADSGNRNRNKIRKKVFALFMAIVFLMNGMDLPGLVTAHAAGVATMSSIYFVRTKVMGSSTVTDRLEIYGTNFSNPEVYGGIDGDIALTVNTSESSATKIVINVQGQPPMALTDQVKIKVMNNGGADLVKIVNFDFSGTPTINSISLNKVYAGDALDIFGFGFDKLVGADGGGASLDALYISDEKYTLTGVGSPEAVIDPAGTKISVADIKNPANPNSKDIYLLRKLGLDNGVNRYIKTVYQDCISIVQPISNVEIERVDPNTGPKTVENIITLYGKSGKSSFTADMKLYIARAGEILPGTPTTLELVKDAGNVVIGLKVKLPKMLTLVSGPVDLVLKSADGKSELSIPAGFIFVDAGNGLMINSTPGSISPNSKKETATTPVTIKGQNIGYFSSTSYSNISGVAYVKMGDTIPDYPTFNDVNSYKVMYTGKYFAEDIVIIREIFVIINDRAPVDSANANPLVITAGQDTIRVIPGNVSITEPLVTNVAIKTKTTIFKTSDNSVVYNRAEEYISEKSFTYVPDEVVPTITSVTPKYSQDPVGVTPDQDVYMTIKGTKFEVTQDALGNPVYPTVTITNGIKTRTLRNVLVYTNTNELLDGSEINEMGTKIKCRITKYREATGLTVDDLYSGTYNVVVENPSLGRNTLVGGYEFRNPLPSAKLPVITNVVEAYCDIKGGEVSGESSKITGLYIDKAAVITIDGEPVTKFVSPVSVDGKTVTIIPPAGTVAGETRLQIINENGGLVSTPFEYKKVTTSPKITKITPIYGSKGTKLIIKGEGFISPVAYGETTPKDNANDPAFKGSYVMFNEYELNRYLYDATGKYEAAGSPPSIYYSSPIMNGKMVQVIDNNTIYVDVPDQFYRFKAGAAPFEEVIPILPGKYRVEVRNPDGGKTKENITFDYMASILKPEITSVDPNFASSAGGTMVTITGKDFLKSGIAVFFGEDQSTKVEFVSTTELKVLVPPCTGKLVNNELIVPIMVLNSDGSAAVLYDISDPLNYKGFKYKIPGSKPTITAVKPATGSTSGGDTIYLEGTQFWRKDAVDQEIPKVYINGIQATVDWFQDGLICTKLKVTTPPSLVEGPVDIVLINYDAGTASFKGFSYVRTKPVITAITPNMVALNGNSNAYITGSSFTKWSTITETITNPNDGQKEKVTVAGNLVDADTVIQSLVYFGDVATGDQKIIDSAGGPYFTVLDNIKVTVQRKSDLITNVKLSLASDLNDTAIGTCEMDLPAGKPHLFILPVKDPNNPNIQIGPAEEGVLVRVFSEQVIVQRRVAVQVSLGDKDVNMTNSYGSAMVVSPPFNRIGDRKVYLENPDGSVASFAVKVTNPLSKPTITDIAPKSAYKDTLGVVQTVAAGGALPPAASVTEWYTYVPLTGGVQLVITGSDFRDDLIVKLNEKPVEIVSKSTDKTKLVVKVPAAVAADYNQLKRIIIINADGASVDSSKLAKPHYIMYKESNSMPVVKTLSRNKTSKNLDAVALADYNKITLNGSGFIPGMRVFIGNVESPQVDAIALTGGGFSDEQMIVTVPKDLPLGMNTLQVINPDNGFYEMKNAVEVISDPKIDAVKTDKGALISPLYLSIEGGQKIRLESTIARFTDGAKVIVGGTLKTKAEALAAGQTGLACTNNKDQDLVIVGGVPATSVTLVDDKTLTLVTPRQAIGVTTIIVLAKDNGVSNVITGDYQKPYPDKPTGLLATTVDSNTIKLEWPFMEGIRYYEVYVSKSAAFKYDSAGDKYEYKGSITPIDIGSGTLTTYVDGLTPNTYYSFKLKAINNFGASKYSDASAKYLVNTKPVGFVKTMTSAITDSFQGTNSYKDNFTVEDKLSYQGMTSILTAGERSMISGLLTVSYNKPQFILNDPKVLDISVALLKKYQNVNIVVEDYSLTLRMTSGGLITSQVESLSTETEKDAKMSLSLDKRQGKSADQIKVRIPSGYGMVLQPIKIGLDLHQGKTIVPQKQFSSNAEASFKYAATKAKKYPGGVYVAYYNTYTKKLELLNTVSAEGISDSSIINTGSYIVIGKKTKSK